MNISRSPGSFAPVSKAMRPAAIASAFAATVCCQSRESSSGTSLQKSPTLAFGFCSESVRPAVHAASVQVVCTSLTEVAVTGDSGATGAHAAEIG